MNREDIFRMAQEAGFDTDLPPFKDGTAIALKLAKLVARHEREACAKLCEEQMQGKSIWIQGARACSLAIRARGQV
jgi:hypothetical protein